MSTLNKIPGLTELLQIAKNLLTAADLNESSQLHFDLDTKLKAFFEPTNLTNLEELASQLYATHSEEGYYVLEQLEQVASSLVVNYGSGVHEYKTWAIPLIFLTDGELDPKNRTLILNDNWDKLVQSIGVLPEFRSAESYKVLNYLYSPNSLLQLPLRDIQKFPEYALSLSFEDSQDPLKLGCGPWSAVPKNSNSATLHVKYLLVVAKYSETGPKYREYSDGGSLAQTLEWATIADYLVLNCLPAATNVRVLNVNPPAPFFAGLRYGSGLFAGMGVSMGLTFQLTATDLVGAGVEAVVAPFASDTNIAELRVSLLSLLDQSLVAGYVVSVGMGENPSFMLDIVTASIRKLGINQIIVSDDVFSLSNGNGLYLTHNGLEPLGAPDFTHTPMPVPNDKPLIYVPDSVRRVFH